MDSSLPEVPAGDPAAQSADDVGTFEQGSPFSRWALARYLVGRVILERVSWALLAVALVFLALAAVFQWVLDSTFLAIVAVVIAVFDLLLRAALRAVLRRLMGAQHYGPLEQRLRSVADSASSDVLAELRRVGLPSRVLTLPLIGLRLIGGRRRKQTIAKMREFDVERAVSKARLDELHLVLREAFGPGSQ